MATILEVVGSAFWVSVALVYWEHRESLRYLDETPKLPKATARYQ